jgi:hypothetical protein
LFIAPFFAVSAQDLVVTKEDAGEADRRSDAWIHAEVRVDEEYEVGPVLLGFGCSGFGSCRQAQADG